MNQAYKVVWNVSRQMWIAVSERNNGQSHGITTSPFKKEGLKRSVLLVTGLTILSGQAIADNWNGGTGDWTAIANWADSTVPTNGDDVYINNGTAQINGATANANGIDIRSLASSVSGLEISNGGQLTSGNVWIAASSASTVTTTVTGSGSSWTADQLQVGFAGVGTLNILDGASVTSTVGTLSGGVIGGNGIANIDGAGSIWTITPNGLSLGGNGGGTLTVSNGGQITAPYINLNYGQGLGSVINIGAALGDAAVAPGTLNVSNVRFNHATTDIIFNHTDNAYEFTPDFTGSGTFRLVAGTTHFSGTPSLSGNPFTGMMSVQGGTLSIAANDTLSLGGDYNQTASGVLKIGVSDDTTYGKLVVAGTATLASNAKIDVNVANPNFSFSATDMQDIISAGTLSSDGTFTTSDNSVLFDFNAVKDGNTVDLVLGAPGSFGGSTGVLSSVTGTGSMSAVGAAKVLDGLAADFAGGSTGNADMDDVIRALGALTTEREVSDAATQTLPLLVTGTSQVATNALHSTNRVVQARQASFKGLSSGDDMLTDRYLWLKPVGNWTHQSSRNSVGGYRADSYGVVGGLDGEINEYTRLGFAVSYMNSNVDGKGSSSNGSADINAYQAIFYGSHSFENKPNIELNWQADIGINNNKGQRVISFMNRVASADYDSYTAHIGVGAGHSFQLNDKTTVIPSIRADYAYIKDESYSETGAGALNLNVGSNSSDELIVMAQGNLSHSLNDQVTLKANAGVGYDLLNDTTSLTASYAGGGTIFTTQGIDPSPWLARVGAGLSYATSETSTLTASYDLEGRSDFLSQTASVKFRWMF